MSRDAEETIFLNDNKSKYQKW